MLDRAKHAKFTMLPTLQTRSPTTRCSLLLLLLTVLAAALLLLPRAAPDARLVGSETPDLPPAPKGVTCVDDDCMREFDRCWLEDCTVIYCPDAQHMSRRARESSPCYNQCFFWCLRKFSDRANFG